LVKIGQVGLTSPLFKPRSEVVPGTEFRLTLATLVLLRNTKLYESTKKWFVVS